MIYCLRFFSFTGLMEQQKMQYVLKTLADPTKLREKLLSLVEEFGKLSKKDDLGWVMLAKLLYTCEREDLKTISSRVQKRLIAASKQPITVPLLHFVRSFVVRFPWLKTSNEQTLAKICSHAVDFAVENYSVEIVRLSSDIYELWVGNKYDQFLVKSLRNVLGDVIAEEDGAKGDVLHFKTASQRYLPQFTSTVFRMHIAVMEHSVSGAEIAVSEWLDVGCKAMAVGDEEIDRSVFLWLKTFLRRAKNCAQLASRRISSFLIDFCRPNEAYYKAVKEYIHLGPNLSVNALFKALIHDASAQLRSRECGKAYAEALGAILELRPYLLCVQDVIQLQHWVCQEAFQNRDCRPALSLLNSFLAMNHELVPSPIQIAQSIFCSSRDWCDEMRFGRALCCAISRPHIQTIVSQENALKKLNDIMMNNQHVGPQFSSELALHDELKRSSHNVPMKDDDTIDNDEIIVLNAPSLEVADFRAPENAKKRGRLNLEEAAAKKRVRTDSETEQICGSSGGESSNSSDSVEIVSGEQVRNKKACSGKQKASEDATVRGDIESVKRISETDVVIVEDNTGSVELTVEQMMADFVPT